MAESYVFPRDGRVAVPVAARGEGAHIVGADGKRYLDGCGGAAVSCLGHSNAAVAKAAAAQMQKLAYAHTSFFTTAAAEELARELTKRAPGNLRRAYFVSGGSEAMETALKLARQYFCEKGESERKNFVARRQSYHGNTLGALSVGGNAARRALYEPMLSPCAHFVPPCHYWREGKEGESESEYAARAANELENKINELGAETVAAFVAETVGGATVGAVPPPPGYFRRIREICDRNGMLLILDEVMCGMGRTGALFACKKEGVAPDIVCLAKGLGAGVMPIGAALCGEEIYDALAGGSGFFRHGHTYCAHPAACAAGLAALGEIEKLLPNARAVGKQLMSLLKENFGAHPNVGDIRGRGMFIGMEFTREGKTPFPAEKRIHSQVQRAAFAEGLMVYGAGGCADGKEGDHILIAPPFIFSGENAEELTQKLSRALTKVF